MAAPAVVVNILARYDDLKNKLGQAASEIEGFSKRTTSVFKSAFGDLTSIATSRFGVAGNEAKKALDGMASDAVSSGSAIGLGVGAGAAVAAAGIAKLAADGVKSFVSLADQIRNIQRLSGASAADASRLNATFEALGVDADAGARAIFLLSKNIDTNAQKLREHGVAIAYNKNGSVDLYQTLLNVRDAYQRAGEGAEGNAIAAAAFGRSGAALLPVLSATRDRLNDINSAAERHGQFLSQDEIDKAKQYQIAMGELHQAVGGLERALGEGLVPILTGTANALDRVITDVDHAAKKVGGLGGIVKGVTENMLPGIPILELFADGSKKAGDASTEAGSAAAGFAGSLDDVSSSAKSAADQASAYASGLDAVKEAEFGVSDAQDAVTDGLLQLEDKAKSAAKARQDAVRNEQDAVQSLADAEENAADRIASAQDQVTKAQDDASKINKPGQQRDEAAKRVADAEKNLSKTQRDANREVLRAHQDIARAAQAVKDATDQWSPSLDRATEAGLKNRTAFEQIVDDALKTAGEMNKQGDTAQQINAYLQTEIGRVQAIGDKWGFNRDQLQQYLGVLSGAETSKFGGFGGLAAFRDSFSPPGPVYPSNATTLNVNVTTNSNEAQDIAAEIAKQVDRALRRRG